MKNILLVICVLCARVALGQDSPQPKFVYCQISSNGSAYASVVTIEAIGIDFGKKMKPFSDHLKGGKNIEFVSLIDALNYMSRMGWEYVQTFVSPISGSQKTGFMYNMILKKPFGELDDESKKEYMKD